MRVRASLLLIVAAGLTACGGAAMPDAGAGGGGSASTGGGTAMTGGGTSATGGGAATGGGTGGGGAALGLGSTCQSGAQCASTFCVDGVCCNVACTGGCQACSATRTGGTNGTCAPLPDGQVCRQGAGPCDVAEVCRNGLCGADTFIDAGTPCRASAGTCDPAELCTGDDPVCPPDVRSAGTTCRSSTGVCDVEERCDGVNPACPTDALADVGVSCRAAAGLCDAEEVCTGAQTTCPTDSKRALGAVCRPAAGPCDVAETCSGSSNDCAPVDVFLPSTATVCAPYRCTGMDAVCATSCGSDSSCAPTSRSICVNGHCETARLVFVTSGQFNADFGGTDAGDALCQRHANDAGLGGAFLAWLSTPASSPSQRFVRDGGIYIRLVDKARVATDWADLTNGLTSAIAYTEKGVVPAMGNRHVFTGTTGTGLSATVSGGNTNTNCSNWTNATSAFNGMWGQCDAINISQPSWTANGPSQCQTLNLGRLYCFEQ